MTNHELTIDHDAVQQLRHSLTEGELEFRTHRLINKLIPGWDTGVETDEEMAELLRRQMIVIELAPENVHVQEKFSGDFRVTFSSYLMTAKSTVHVEGTEDEMRATVTKALAKLAAEEAAFRAEHWV